MIKKALKNNKNDILHAGLENVDKTYSKKIVLMVDDIDGDPTKICFCKLFINAKITQNSRSKPMSEVIFKLVRAHIGLSGPSFDIFFKTNCYIWTATN